MPQNHISDNLTTYFNVFKESLNKPQFSHFKSWIQGLLHGKIHGSEVAKHFSSKHETSLTRFHSKSIWKHEEVNQVRINHAVNVASQQPIEETQDFEAKTDNFVCYIIDDTTNEKHGKKIPGIGYYWSNTAKRAVWGQKLVTSHMRIGDVDFPLFASQYDKTNKQSKIDIAIEHIEKFPSPKEGKRGIVLVDTWFGSKKIIKKAKSRSMDIITMIKRNRLIKPEGLDDPHWISVKKISGALRKSGLRRVKVGNTKFRFAQIHGSIKDLKDETFKILVVQQYLPSKRKWSKYKYLLSSDASMDSSQSLQEKMGY